MEETRGPGPTARARGAGVRLALALAVLLALVAAVLAPVLAAGFVADDRVDVRDNPAATPAGFTAALGVTNRPLTKASYALERVFAGDGDDPRPFHAVNLALHLLTTLAVFAFVRRLLHPRAAVDADLLAWLAAALWALHPATVATVAPVSGRSMGLSSLLLLAAFLLATGERPPGRGAAVAVLLLAAAAPLARETALVLPALLLLWQATLGAGEDRAAALRRQIPALAGTALGALAIAASQRHRELLAFSFHTRTPLDSLRGNLPALFDILRLWVAPDRISVDPAAPADLPWSAPAMLLGLAALAAAAAFVVGARRRRPAAAFAVGWTLVALAPANSLVWRLDPVAVRPLYLAALGPVLLLALAAARLATALRAAAPPRARLAAVAAVLLLAAALPLAALARETRHRARLWSDPAALWADAALKAPGRSRPWLNLGVALLIADRLDDAEVALGAALAADPAEQRARCALASLRIRRYGKTLDERSLTR